MVEYKKGCFARSKAGHDKGKIYIIIEGTEETGREDFLMVTDGDLKPIEKPKGKKTRHVQVVHQMDETIEEKIKSRQDLKNEDIKKAIKAYTRSETSRF